MNLCHQKTRSIDSAIPARRLVFLDWEFTSLADPELLSFALVADDGREFYVELSGDAHLKRASNFVLDTVAPQFGLVSRAETSRIDIGKRLGAWLVEFSESSIDILYDFHADMDLLESSLRAAAMWIQLKLGLVPTHVGYLIGETDVTAAMEASWKASFVADGIARHHALADARALRAGYMVMHGGGLTSECWDEIEAGMGLVGGRDGADPMRSFLALNHLAAAINAYRKVSLTVDIT